jgi:hypothetical protein
MATDSAQPARHIFIMQEVGHIVQTTRCRCTAVQLITCQGQYSSTSTRTRQPQTWPSCKCYCMLTQQLPLMSTTLSLCLSQLLTSLILLT